MLFWILISLSPKSTVSYRDSAPGFIASMGSVITGSGSYSTTTARAAASARASVSAATAATASPIRRTFSARM